MKKLLLALFCLTLGATVSAQQLDYLTFRMADGSEKSLPVDGLKITFEGTQLHAVAQGEKADFNLSEMGLMFFSATPTGLESVREDRDPVVIVDGRLVVEPGEDIQVYSMEGLEVKADRLSRGVYLVKKNGRTFKVLVK